jgi:hypothetical protein
MGRIITNARREQIRQARIDDPDALGPKLAELALDGNVPIGAVAVLLAVSEPTIYRWMYAESHPRDRDKILKINRLLTVLRKAKRAKELPLEGTVAERTDKVAELVAKYRPAPRATI